MLDEEEITMSTSRITALKMTMTDMNDRTGQEEPQIAAGFIRELIIAGTHEGLAAARARGRVGGRPTVVDAERRSISVTAAGSTCLAVSQVFRQAESGSGR
ncbi:hypothetical protein [Nonomuraea sp. NPDC050540]|uniref:hypothetical protein n=1 Tax=Nonomuraea sp. NPDC050540 TaxID=3364367 RepID=UPI0037AADC1A